MCGCCARMWLFLLFFYCASVCRPTTASSYSQIWGGVRLCAMICEVEMSVTARKQPLVSFSSLTRQWQTRGSICAAVSYMSDQKRQCNQCSHQCQSNEKHSKQPTKLKPIRWKDVSLWAVTTWKNLKISAASTWMCILKWNLTFRHKSSMCVWLFCMC